MDPEPPDNPDDDIADLDSADVDVRDPPEEETKKKIIQDGSEKHQEAEEEPKSPLLVTKSEDQNQDAAEDGGSSSQHVPVNESMVLDALEVLEKRYIRGLAIDAILEYLCLRYPVNRAKDQLLVELNERLEELVEGGLVHLGPNGKYRLTSFLEQSQQAEGRFGDPAPKAPPRPKATGRTSRSRARPEAAPRRRRSGSSSTSSTSSGSSRSRKRSRSPRQSASPRGRPRGRSPAYTREQPRRSKRLMKKRRR